MTIEEIIKQNTTENGFQYGINTVMTSIRPGCLFSIRANGGEFEVIDWPDNQWSDKLQRYIEPPTSQEIHDEYIRHKTIAECIEYFKKNN